MISLKDVRKAYESIKGKIYRTPVLTRDFVNSAYGNEITLKLENLQRSGAFKIRGVFNKIGSLTEKERQNGIICATSGNHGLGVAYISHWEKLKALVVIPKNTPEYKVDRLKKLARVEIKGDSFLESYHYAIKKAEKENLTFIHPFADPLIIAGQGTIALELIEQVPDMDCIVAPIGGGGLISGLLIAIKEIRPRIKVIGVQAQGAASMYISWKAGKIKSLKTIDTIAEGIAVKKTEKINLEIIKKYVDDIVLVEDDDIRFAMKTLFDEYKVVGETAGVAALAAILRGKTGLKGQKIVSVITGGNLSRQQFIAHTV